MVFNLSNVNFKLVEIGIAIVVLAVFIALFALVKEFAGAWSSFAYALLVLAFIVVICLIGLKLAPQAS